MGYNRQKIKENTFFLHFFAKIFGHVKKKQYLCTRFREGSSVLTKNAAIAQLVEHNLAKVGVASSSLVFRSKNLRQRLAVFFLYIIPNPYRLVEALRPSMTLWVKPAASIALRPLIVRPPGVVTRSISASG